MENLDLRDEENRKGYITIFVFVFFIIGGKIPVAKNLPPLFQ
jgi:hypothetical protein